MIQRKQIDYFKMVMSDVNTKTKAILALFHELMDDEESTRIQNEMKSRNTAGIYIMYLYYVVQ